MTIETALATSTANNTNLNYVGSVGLWGVAGQSELIVLVVEDTATGTAAAFTTSSGAQLEGLSVGADWSVTTSDCDEVANDSTNSRFIRVWSARIDALAGAETITITTTYAGSSGIRRSQVYRVATNEGTIPVRASRKAGSVAVTNTTNGANTVDAFSLSAITSLDAALIGGYYTANTMASSPVLDANGDGTTYEATAAVNGNGCGGFGQPYEAAASVRPAIPANVKWVSNPGTGGKSFVFVEYALETPAPVIITGTAATEAEDPIVGQMLQSGIQYGTVVTEGEHPVHGLIPVYILGSTVTEAETPVGHPSLETIFATYHFTPRKLVGVRYKTLHVTVFNASPSDVADIRLTVLQGSTVIDQGSWQALSDTPTQFSLTVAGSITDFSDVYGKYEVRKSTENSDQPRISEMEMLPEYWVVEQERAKAGQAPSSKTSHFFIFFSPGGV